MTEKTTRTNLLLVGKIVSPHGVKGWNKIVSYTEPAANIFKYQPWQLKHRGILQTIRLMNHQAQHGNLLIQIEGCQDRETAQGFCGIGIYIDRQQLPPLEPGTYYQTDLQGLNVYNRQAVLLGKVAQVMPTGSNDVLVVEGKKRHLIPFLIGQSIDAVDLEKGVIQVDWDEDF